MNIIKLCEYNLPYIFFPDIILIYNIIYRHAGVLLPAGADPLPGAGVRHSAGGAHHTQRQEDAGTGAAADIQVRAFCYC